MIYTIRESGGKKQTFEGFASPYIKTMAHPQVLAVATVDGTVDLWRLDKDNVPNALSELARMYRMDGHVVCGVDEDVPEATVRIAVFRRDTTSGCSV